MAMKKLWGWKNPIVQFHGVIVDHLLIDPKGYSSIHTHAILRNYFYILDLKKELHIEVFSSDMVIKDGMEPEATLVLGGVNRSTSISPGQIHRFRNMSDEVVEVIEISFDPGIEIEQDIERYIPGGIG